MSHNPNANGMGRPATMRANTGEEPDPVRRRHLIEALQAGSDLRRRRCRELVEQYLTYGRADSRRITQFLMYRDETGKLATDLVMAERGQRDVA